MIKISLGINEAVLGSLTMCYSIQDVETQWHTIPCNLYTTTHYFQCFMSHCSKRSKKVDNKK